VSSDERPVPQADPTPARPAPDAGAPAAPIPGRAAPEDDVAANPGLDPDPDPDPDEDPDPVHTGPAPVPDADTLERIATPAELRRAPKVSAFITTGVLVGVVLGWLLAVLGSGTSGEARTGAILLTAGGLGVLGATVGAGLAALADRRSVRSRRSRAGR
jgi:hypothetical protein